MKKYLLLGFVLSAGLVANAQTYMPVTLSGFNADVVADGAGSAMVSTNNDVDGGGYVLVAQNFINPAGQSPSAAGSLPTSGLITSAVTTTPGLTFQLAPFSAPNSLRIASAASGSIAFSSPSSASDIYVLVTPVAYTTTFLFNATVTFADATTQVFTGISVPNWFGGANPAFSGNSRVSRTNNTISVNAQGPRMYQYKLTLNAANNSKPIQSIQFTNTSAATSGNILNVMAVTTAGGSPSLPNDVGIISSSAPNSGCTLTNQETITVNLKNFGMNAQSNIPVSYTLNNGTPVSEIFTGTLASNATIAYSFTAKANLNALATYNLVITTGLTNDGQPANDSFSRSVTKFAAPNTPTVAASGQTAICPGTTTLLTATGATGAIYQWYKDGVVLSGISSASYAVYQPGNYTVIASANGCSSSVSNAVSITQSPAPTAPFVSASGLPAICSGTSVMLTASSPSSGVTYSWLLDGSTIPGASGATFMASMPGRYTAMAMAGGCSSNTSGGVTVTVAATPVQPTITQTGNLLTSSSGVGNQWYVNGGPIAGATNQTYTATTSGSYTVTVTDNICSSNPSNPVNLIVSGISDQVNSPLISIYPNPSNGQFIISLPEQKRSELQISDLTGKIILTRILTEKETQLNLYKAAKGIYLLKITSGTTTSTQKHFVE